eukprot:1730604-Amphidinium_carterae.1
MQMSPYQASIATRQLSTTLVGVQGSKRSEVYDESKEPLAARTLCCYSCFMLRYCYVLWYFPFPKQMGCRVSTRMSNNPFSLTGEKADPETKTTSETWNRLS